MSWRYIIALPSNSYYEALTGFARMIQNPTLEYDHELIQKLSSHSVKTATDTVKVTLGEGKDNETLYLHKIDVDTLKDSPKVACSTIPNLTDLLAPLFASEFRVDFEIEAKQCIFYPATKAFAGRIIRLLFNELKDPVDRADDLKEILAEGQNLSSLVVTYYLSCIKVMLDIDIRSIIIGAEDTECCGTANIFNLFKSNPTAVQMLEQSTNHEKISSNILAFHALFGAYAFCRSTNSKHDLSKWCGSRYNALMNSLTLQTNSGISFSLTKSGDVLNQIGNFRPYLKALPCRVLRLASLPARAVPIKQHINMLASYANMTTYIFINKVIRHGGPVLTLNPIPNQLYAYVKELNNVSTYLKSRGDPQLDTLPFINILYPQEQFFKAASYPDMIVVARELEIQQHSDPENLIKNYKSKATSLSTVNLKQVRQLLKASTGSCITRSLTMEQEQLIKKETGIDLASLTEEANKVIAKFQRYRRNAPDLDDEI